MSAIPNLVLVYLRDTKNWALYQEENNAMNKVYRPKGLPKRIVYQPVEESSNGAVPERGQQG